MFFQVAFQINCFLYLFGSTNISIFLNLREKLTLYSDK